MAAGSDVQDTLNMQDLSTPDILKRNQQTDVDVFINLCLEKCDPIKNLLDTYSDQVGSELRTRAVRFYWLSGVHSPSLPEKIIAKIFT